MSVIAVFAVIVAMLDSEPLWLCANAWIACDAAGHAIAISRMSLAIDFATSHHTCMPNIRLMPFSGLSRLKSGFIFLPVGWKPTWATATAMVITSIPQSIGARMPTAASAALVMNFSAAGWL